MKIERRKMTALDNGNLTDNPKVKNISRLRHWHPEVEFLYVKKGELLLEHGQELISIDTGKIFIISRNVPHTYVEIEKESELLIIKVNVNQIWKYQESLPDFKIDDNSFLLTQVDEEILSHFGEMMESDYGKYTDLFVTAKAYEFFAYIKSGKILAVEEIKAKSIEASNVVFQIKDFLIKNLTEEITLNSLAEHLGLSKNHCSKIIQEKTTLSFTEYLNHLRVKSAENLLIDTDKAIFEICYEAGFNSIQSFNRNFKKYSGVSPSQYRKIYMK